MDDAERDAIETLKKLKQEVWKLAVDAECERIAAWLERQRCAPNIETERTRALYMGLTGALATLIRNGEHRAAGGESPKARPLDALQVAKLKAYRARCYPCTCSPPAYADPNCHGCRVTDFADEVCDGTFLEPVAASGENQETAND